MSADVPQIRCRCEWCETGRPRHSWRPSGVSCRLCGEKTAGEATRLCDSCYELDRRIRERPGIAAVILHAIQAVKSPPKPAPKRRRAKPKRKPRDLKTQAFDRLLDQIGRRDSKRD